MKAPGYFLVVPLLITVSVRGEPVSFDFSSLGISQVVFDGTAGSVAFLPDSSGYDFQISSSNLPGLAGLDGNISGTFYIGAVSSSGLLQSAPITGTGTYSISDGSSLFTATLSWVDVEVFGSSGGLNASGLVNLSNFTYSGSNAALADLADYSDGTVVTSFQFSSLESLSQLATGGTLESTSYSGSAVVAVPDGGSTAILLGPAFLGLAAIRWRSRRLAVCFGCTC
jgi:VPDSG-CTERM motif